MLDENSKKVLKYFIDNDTELDAMVIACNLKLEDANDLDKVDKCLNILCECKYIKKSDSSLDSRTYVLTNNGRHYFDKKRNDNFYKFWYPIIVSVITSILSFLASLLIN